MDLELSTRARSVHVNGAPLPLGARAFDVLAHLFANADRVVSKAELLNAVWSDLTVEESNLTVQISALRKALGKEAIKTVPGIGYRLALAPTAAPVQADGPEIPSIPSLAVLPFSNLTGDPDRGYLVDGIVQEITSALSRISGIFVISSTSSFTYKGRSVDLSEVSCELGVRYVLEGSIQAAGNRLRIFTHLVEAESGHTIWQERFDGTSDDIFELQDMVAAQVAGALEPKLQATEASRIRAKPTDVPAAYDLCLRATPIILKIHAQEDLTNGLALLRQALELDPDYMMAHALITYAHTTAFATRWWTYDQARAALPHARKILDSDTEDPIALAYAGHHVAYLARDYQTGLTALKRAAHLNPNSGTVEMLIGWVYIYVAENDAAIAHLTRAKRLSPLHPHIAVINSGIGHAYLQKGDLDNAVAFLEQAMTEYPEFGSNQIVLMAAYWASGRKADAMRMAEWVRRKVPDMSVTLYRNTRPHTNAALMAAMTEALRGTGFPED